MNLSQWDWHSLDPIYLLSHIIASSKDQVAVLTSLPYKGYPCYFIQLRSKNLKYAFEYGTNTRDARTVWELECQKSRLINEGFKINWENYQLILNMYVNHFKIYSPYLIK